MARPVPGVDKDEAPPSVNRFDPGLVDGLREPTKDLVVQMLLYKSTFTSSMFRMLAQREPPAVRDALLLVSRETLTETAALSLRMREWDVHPVAWDTMMDATQQVRRRFLEDFIRLKEGMAETGLVVAMRAPGDELRGHLLKLADVDRRHSAILRGLLGARAPVDRMGPSTEAAGPLGAAQGRASGRSLSATIDETAREIRDRGGVPTRLTVSADGLRHLRDEGVIEPEAGKAFGLFVDVDMGWRGECYAVSTQDRLGYAEIITAARARDHPAKPG